MCSGQSHIISLCFRSTMRPYQQGSQEHPESHTFDHLCYIYILGATSESNRSAILGANELIKSFSNVGSKRVNQIVQQCWEQTSESNRSAILGANE